MKAFILVSSLFYLLGLKISNTIDVFKNNSSTEPILIEQPAIQKDKSKNASFTKELKGVPSDPDSTGVSGSTQSLAPKVEE